MTSNQIKAILTSLRAMVIKMLPAYKFYLGSTTVNVSTQICHGVMSVKKGNTRGNGALTLDDSSFAGFVEGETYTVAVNGVSGEYVAKPVGDVLGVTNAAEIENPPEDLWAAAFVQGTCKYSVAGSYANATISVSQTKTVTTKKYKTKKLDNSLLPDGVESGIEAANTKAATALSAAQAAKDTANEAISSANTAQSTANTAKSTAETALPKTGGTMSGNIIVGEGSGYWVETSRTSIRVKHTNSVTGNVSNELEMLGAPTPAVTGGNGNGAFYIGSDGLTVGNESNNNGRITLLHNAGSSTDAHISILHRGKYLTLTSSGKISSNSRVTFENGEIEVGLPAGQTGNTAIILRSYSAGSTKRFRITVDDTGTLKATEVTDA